MRGNLGLSLINVKVGFCQTLVQEKCDLNWYQSAVALTQAYDQAEFSLLFLGKRDLFQMNFYSDFTAQLKLGHLPFTCYQENLRYEQALKAREEQKDSATKEEMAH